MDEVRCFLIEPTGQTARFLRRFTWSSRGGPHCPGPTKHHDAKVRIEDGTCQLVEADVGWRIWRGHPERDIGDHWPHDDPRWPARCDACAYVFRPDDQWQVFWDALYGPCSQEPDRAPGPGPWMLRDVPTGSMWWAPWVPQLEQGPEGLGGLTVLLPDGVPWNIDGAAYPKNGLPKEHAWTRSGTPPQVTARPSILTPGYHGFLTDGVLRPC